MPSPKPDTGDSADEFNSLSPRQQIAIDVLAAGRTQKEAADAADVTRETVNRWKRVPAFTAALNARLAEHRRANGIKAMSVTTRAIEVIEEAIDGGDVRAARDWIRLVGVDRIADTEIGPTDADEIIDLETRRHLQRLAQEETDLQLADISLADPGLVRRAVIDDLRAAAGVGPDLAALHERPPARIEVFAATTEAAERIDASGPSATGMRRRVKLPLELDEDDFRLVLEGLANNLWNVDDHPHLDPVTSADTYLVVPLEPRLVAELARAKDDRLWATARMWVGRQKLMPQFHPQDAYSLLKTLRQLAKAVHEDEQLYLWSALPENLSAEDHDPAERDGM